MSLVLECLKFYVLMILILNIFREETTYNKVSWNLPPFSPTSNLQWPPARVNLVIGPALKSAITSVKACCTIAPQPIATCVACWHRGSNWRKSWSLSTRHCTRPSSVSVSKSWKIAWKWPLPNQFINILVLVNSRQTKWNKSYRQVIIKINSNNKYN